MYGQCEVCGTGFYSNEVGRPRRFCSDRCRQASARARKAAAASHPAGCPCDDCAMGEGSFDAETARVLAEARAIPGGRYPDSTPGPSMATAQDVEYERLSAGLQVFEKSSRLSSANPSIVRHWLRTGEIWNDPANPSQKALVADTTGAILLPPQFAVDIATVARDAGTIRQLVGAAVRPVSGIKHRAGLISAASVGWGRLETGVTPTDAGISVSSPALDIDTWDVNALAQIGVDELDDNAPLAVQAAITEAVGIALAEAEDAAFANGTGTNQPKGLALAANVARVPAGQKVAAAASATPTAADLVSIPPKLPVKYRRAAVWLASTDMYAKIIALLYPSTALMTAAGPLQGPCGYPVYEVPGLPSAATAGTTDASVWFVNLPLAYRVASRTEITLQRLTERYIDQGYVGLLVRRRVGGDLVRPDAACIYAL